MHTIFATPKGARLDVDGPVLRFTPPKSTDARACGDVVLDAPACTTPRYGQTRPSPAHDEILAFLREATARSAVPDAMRAFFIHRKLGWPQGFLEVLRFGAHLFLITAGKPEYWYVLDRIHLYGVRCADAAAAAALEDALRDAQPPDTLTSAGGQKGTYRHELWLRSAVVPSPYTEDPGEQDIVVATTWVRTAVARFGEHTALGGPPTPIELRDVGSVDEAARRCGESLVEHLLAGATLSRLVLSDGVLPLDNEALAAATAALAPAKKPKAKRATAKARR